jgi:hypothetical protein
MPVAIPALQEVRSKVKRAVADKIKGLRLAGGPLPGGQGSMADIGDSVHVQMFPDSSNITFPCILVTTEGEKETPVGGTNFTGEFWFPVRVIICDRASTRRNENEPYYFYWREQIYMNFWHQKILGLSEICGCEIDTEVIFDPRLPFFQYIVSGLLLRFYIGELLPFAAGEGY